MSRYQTINGVLYEMNDNISTPVDKEYVDVHIDNTVVHVEQIDKDKWNAGTVGEPGVSPFEVTIISSRGDKFKAQVTFTTTLIAYVYQGGSEITNDISASRFIWIRTTSDSEGDLTWNQYHIGYKSISINQDDVLGSTTFTCEISS